MSVSVTSTEGTLPCVAWLEAEVIEKALQWHTCGIERAFMYNGREPSFFKYADMQHSPFSLYIFSALAPFG
jgi:hypothetical protein